MGMRWGVSFGWLCFSDGVSEELLTAMGGFSEVLVKAGVMLAGESLHPTSKGARLRVSGGKPVITDGPFTEAKEVIAGFWMIQVKSKEEALEWAKRCPLPEGGILDIYRIFEPATDFPPELRPKSAKA